MGYTAGEITRDETRGIRICFLKSEHLSAKTQAVTVELIAPDGVPNPVDGILKKMGPTPYHICYSTSDLEKTISALTKNDTYILIQSPAPAPAIEGCRVAFLLSRVAGIIELVEL